MTERPAIPWHDRLSLRLGAAFAVTVLVTVAIVTLLALRASDTGIAELAAEQHDATARGVVAALESAYLEAGGWAEADLLPAHTLAATAGAVLIVTTPELGELPTPPELETTRQQLQQRQAPRAPADEDAPGPQRRGSHTPDPQGSAVVAPVSTGPTAPATTTTAEGSDIDERRDLPIVVDGRTVGTATLLFVGRDEPDAATAFRETLLPRLVLGAAAAGVVALLVTGFVTAWLTRPLRRLTRDVDGLRAGAPPAAQDDRPSGPGEIRVLRDALDTMAEDLRRQERLRRALVADVGHELRTPVTILLAELEAMREGVLATEPAQIDSLHEEAQRIARLVEDVGSIADAEASGFALERRHLDLATLTRDALQGIAVSLEEADLSLVTALEPVRVEGDPRRLEQVVRNLLTNAAKFAPAGSTIEVHVRAAGTDAVAEVLDRGPGFPADELPHVFERFWRGSQAGRTGGSGIGLAVVAEVVAAHGGTVAAANRTGGGARLTVRLPRETGAGNARTRPASTADAAGPPTPVGPGR